MPVRDTASTHSTSGGLCALLRTAAVAAISSAITTGILLTWAPSASMYQGPPAAVAGVEPLYPASAGGTPEVVYESHADLIADYQRTKDDLLRLRMAIDRDAAHGRYTGSALHEWADGVNPGTFTAPESASRE